MIKPYQPKTILLVLLLSVAITLPLHIKLNTYAIVAFSLYALATQYKNIKARSFALLFVIYFGLHLIGMLYTENTRDGWALIERSLVYLVFPILLPACLVLSQSDIFKIFVAFIVGTILTAIFEMIPWRAVADDPMVIYRVYLGVYLVMSLVLVYGLWRQHDPADKKNRILLLFLGLVTIPLLVAAQTKMSIFIAGLFFTWQFFTAPIKPKLRLGVLAFLIILLLAAGLYSKTSYRFVELIQKGDLPRWYNWQAALQLIKENFFTGVGTGDAVDALNTKRDVNWFEAFKTYNVHNQYLETFVRLGVFSFITLLGILWNQFRMALRSQSFFYLSFLFIFCFSALTESVLCRNKGITFFAFFSSLNYLLVILKHPQSVPQSTRN